jgi:hypothetical protein
MGRRESSARIGGLLKESLISKRDLGAHLDFAVICTPTFPAGSSLRVICGSNHEPLLRHPISGC